MTTIHEPQEFYVGDTWELEVQCNDGDGNPLSLDTVTEIEWKLDKINDDGSNTPAVDLKLTTGGITLGSTDGIDGVVLITLTADQTSGLAPGTYRDQLRLTFGEYVTTQTAGRIDAIGGII